MAKAHPSGNYFIYCPYAGSYTHTHFTKVTYSGGSTIVTENTKSIQQPNDTLATAGGSSAVDSVKSASRVAELVAMLMSGGCVRLT